MDRVIEILGKGKFAVTGRHFGVTGNAIKKWRKCVPASRVIAIERAVGYRVTRYELRPDIYPRDDGDT